MSLKSLQLSVVAIGVQKIQTIRQFSIFTAPRSKFCNWRKKYFFSIIFIILGICFQSGVSLISSLIFPQVHSIETDINKGKYEVFGFAPHWTLNKLDNVDFDVLTTLAYFDVGVNVDGSLDKNSIGYKTFKSKKASDLFKKAHDKNTKVVLTITQMDNKNIKLLMDSEEAQNRAIEETVKEVVERGIDGINIDFEYVGDPGDEYRAKFTTFIHNIKTIMHQKIPGSKVTVSVYASSVISPKIYDIKAIAYEADSIFMMAYDFAVKGSKFAMPTAPLYGYDTGDYWYDISTAVDDFLTQMPANKLILGVPWYGYDYAVYDPGIKADTHKGYYVSYSYKVGRKKKYAKRLIKPNTLVKTYTLAMDDIDSENIGWDDKGKVGYKAYFSEADNMWRMVFIEDTKSMGIKYDFAKDKRLAGVGMWALGFDNGKTELWDLLANKFGKNYSSSSVFLP